MTEFRRKMLKVRQRIERHKEIDAVVLEYLRTGEVPEGIDEEWIDKAEAFLLGKDELEEASNENSESIDVVPSFLQTFVNSHDSVPYIPEASAECEGTSCGTPTPKNVVNRIK